MDGGKDCTMPFQSGVKLTKNLLMRENVPRNKEGSLPVPQVPIRLMNVWCGRLDGIMDPLPSKVWFVVDCFKAQEHKMSQLSKLIYLTKLF